MYKLFKDVVSGNINTVLRIADNSYIPFDPANIDYQAYLKWLAEGNEPESADE
jgi:hypothetical protein